MASGRIVLPSDVVREGWTLRERLAAAPERRGPGSSALAGPRLAAWQAAVAPHASDHFSKRLRWSGRTIDDAAWAVSAAMAAEPEPAWVATLRQLQQTSVDAVAAPVAAPPGAVEPFADLLWPICRWAVCELQAGLPRVATVAVAPEAFDSLGRALLSRLAPLTEHALFDVFSRHRGIGTSLLASMGGAAEGAPPRDEYDAFVRHHLAAGWSDVLVEYPVLGRLLAVAVRAWMEACGELLQRVHDQRASLAAAFGVAVEARLGGIEMAQGDPHRGGRSVAVLTFDMPGATPRKIVFKPRSMGIDQAYQGCLARLNHLAGDAAFRVLGVLPCGDYGFMEFVAHRPCADDHALRRFYWMAGRLLAVLYLLGCNDCHHENLIADGEQPVLIDVETLLQGDVDESIAAPGVEPGEIHRRLAQSVLRVGLLPQWRFSAAGGRVRAFDGSALGALPHPAVRRDGWVDVNTDRMHWGRVEETPAPPRSYPSAVARPDLLARFRQQIGEGFAAQMGVCLRHKDEWLSPAGPLEAFAGLPRRVVVRPTYIYGYIQRQALQPDALGSAAARGARLEQLARGYLASEETPLDWPLFDSEVQQMEELDVPYFEQRIDDAALALPTGGLIPGFSRSSGLVASRARWRDLDQDDIEFQLQLIQGAIDASQVQADPGSPQVAVSSRPLDAEGSFDDRTDEAHVAEARRLARALEQRALRGSHGRPEWLGLDLGEDQERCQFGLVGPSLYSGRSGIALFFAVLAERLQDDDPTEADRLRAFAASAIAPILDRLESGHQPASSWVRDLLLGLSGAGGILLALLVLERAGGAAPRGRYVEAASTLARHLTSDRIRTDACFDVMGGCAGLVGPLLELAHVAPAGESRDRLDELTGACAEHLAANQLTEGGWPNANARRPLTGFSHGAAGIAAALARLHAAGHRRATLDAGRRALAYERALFSPARRNWPDFRMTGEPTQFSNGWCHGAPGMALSRLCLRSTALWDGAAAEELEVALTTTAEVPAAVDHVCCGELGKAAILNIAATLGRGAGYADAARRIVAERLAAVRRDGEYRLSALVEGRLFLPGLFTGVSGIGVALLSVREPTVTAAVMSCGLLDVPRVAGVFASLPRGRGR